jgi:2-keto-4-pentenoate hydratase/2-oxohepta-3-ene-1,7-dioic acid hydratase in catechol pathway
MKLVTFTSRQGSPRVGILDGDTVTMVASQGTMLSVIQSGITPELTSERFKLADVRLHAPLRPGKIIAVGKNYAAHAAETGDKPPEIPLLFAKLPSSVISPGEAITWSAAVTGQVDWEGELAVVIGRRARAVGEADAPRHIYGYTIANDVSARDLQNAEPQWLRAKGLDTFCPLGPTLVTRNEIADPQGLRIVTTVNGEVMQDAGTEQMVHQVYKLIAYCSQSFTLEPGDLLLTGTPAGVALGMNPPRWLKDGDEISITIDPIGTLTNPCKIV